MFLLLSMWLALYVSGFAYATEVPQGTEKLQIAPSGAEKVPGTPPSADKATGLLQPAAEQPQVTPPPKAENPQPHIALLLPLKSPAFGSAAEAVQQGFQAAANLEQQGLPGALPVRVYGCQDEGKDIVALYRQAIANGAYAVVGPLTRNGVNALAAQPDIPIPTLSLNVADNPASRQLYFFGMEVEAEARQVAQLAQRQGLLQATVITTRAQLSKRLQFAFEEEWNRLGGSLLREIEFNGTMEEFASITDVPGTMVFLAAEAETARLIRPYLPNKLPIYGTSQIFIGNEESLTNYDLNNIRFVDMPWLLEPDHAAVMTYPRATPPLSADLERFYAMGIDAFRIVQLLLARHTNTFIEPLDGVSGQIQLVGQTLRRASIPAQFSQGRAQLLNTPATAVIKPFPDKVITTP